MRGISASKPESDTRAYGQTPSPVGKVRHLVTESLMPRTAPLSPAQKTRGYRQRLRASGSEEVLFQLPRETVALLDELKERHGLRNRSQALLKLIEEGRKVTQQTA